MSLVKNTSCPRQKNPPNNKQNETKTLPPVNGCQTHKPFPLKVEFKIMPGLVELIKKIIHELYFTIKKE